MDCHPRYWVSSPPKNGARERPIYTEVTVNPMAFPLSEGGYTDVIMAIPVPKTMALPMPWTALNRISIFPLVETAHSRELTAIIIFPKKNICFLPLISASFPRGTRNTADVSKKAMETQLIPMAPMEKSSPMAGRATLIAAPRKGLIKEVIMIAKRINLLEALPDSAMAVTNLM
jgi:hypothetical protein